MLFRSNGTPWDLVVVDGVAASLASTATDDRISCNCSGRHQVPPAAVRLARDEPRLSEARDSKCGHHRSSAARIVMPGLCPGHDDETDHFLLLGLCPAGVLPAANGLTGATPPFLRFLSAFGFFFSLLLRI